MFFKDNKAKKAPDKERRRHKRIEKHFLLHYFPIDRPDERFEITQLKNISRGGACIITTKALDVNLKIGIELKTPFISETTYLSGHVLESSAKAENMLYTTRIQFDQLDTQGEYLIDKLLEFFKNDENTDN